MNASVKTNFKEFLFGVQMGWIDKIKKFQKILWHCHFNECTVQYLWVLVVYLKDAPVHSMHYCSRGRVTRLVGNSHGPLINRLNKFFLTIRFCRDIGEISDFMQANTVRSQTKKKIICENSETRPHMLIFRKIVGNPKMANTVRSWIRTGLHCAEFCCHQICLCRPLSALYREY